MVSGFSIFFLILYGEGDLFKFLLFFVFLSLFILIGIFLILKGIKKIIVNYNTSKKGEECFGIIKSVCSTGSSVNGHPIYKVDVIVYLESIRDVEVLSEKIGFKYSLYPVGSCVRLKYYNGDINILESVEFTNMSVNAQYYLKSELDKVDKPDDIVIINGVKYKRVD